MKNESPDIESGYTSQQIDMNYENSKIGTLDINYYGPFYLSNDDRGFINAVNGALVFGILIALVLSFAAGTWMAHRISLPISKVVNASKKLAHGDYSVNNQTEDSTTEIRELISTVNDLAGILSDQELLRRRLTQDMAHELRTPLTALQGHIEAIMDGIWEPSPERIKSCHEEIIRINRMVSDLWELSQYENNTEEISREPVDMGLLISNVYANFESEAAAKNITINYSKNILTIITNKDKMTQVIVNLLSNALKYTSPGGTISILTEDFTDRFELTIKDTGIGIKKEDIPRIFERLYRTDQSRNRKTGGSGIGLSIVKAIVSSLGGNIQVTSVPGLGSRFKITFLK